MKEAFTINKTVFKLWLDSDGLDDLAQSQLEDISKLPFVKSPVNIMADAHGGYGVPIGTVLQTRGHIIPAAIGNDIGCGMTCAILNKSANKTDWQFIFGAIKAVLEPMTLMPNEYRVNLYTHNNPYPNPYESIRMKEGEVEAVKVSKDLSEKTSSHFLTIGGGNHFVEAGETDDGRVYIMVHSGSRGLGSIVADRYGDFACDINEALFSVNSNRDLASIPITGNNVLSNVGREYLRWTERLAKWATNNRMSIIHDVIGSAYGSTDYSDINIVNCTHNFATFDEESGIVTHYKGANKTTSPVIVAGSCGTKSFIAKYRENKHGLFCSHGAGRDMSRTVAKGCITQDDADRATSHVLQNSNPIDECPLAYKNIDVVMDAQSDLVRVIMTLYPKISFK